jgi:hypothetical protein
LCVAGLPRSLTEVLRMLVLRWIFFLLLISLPALAQPVEGDWTYLRMVEDGKTREFSGSGLPWLELKKGLWSLMLSGRLSGGGPYSIAGNRLTMKYEDGSLYGTFQVKMAEPGMILTGVGDSKGFDLHCQRQK